MKWSATSLLLLLSLTLTSALRVDPSSQWMWHGAFPWVYSHAESSWWYMKAGTDGKFYAWKQGDGEWYFFDEASKQWVPLNGGDNGGGQPVDDESGGQATTTWDKRFRGSGEEWCESVIATTDGGYLLVGGSDSPADGDKSEASRGGMDMWVVKIDANGNKVWDKTFGGSDLDYCNAVMKYEARIVPEPLNYWGSPLFKQWWAVADSNCRPHACEALANASVYKGYRILVQLSVQFFVKASGNSGRGIVQRYPPRRGGSIVNFSAFSA